jgi:hypothetical protein
MNLIELKQIGTPFEFDKKCKFTIKFLAFLAKD